MSSYPAADSSSPATLSPKQRRRSAALSCAECRRLKLRCSRVFPCTSCVKKGCAAICPDGSLTTGKGNRFILANTEVLHDKIGQLSTRVRQLEDALAEAHGFHSNERHPLLTDDLLQIKRPLEREAKKEVTPPQEAETAEAIDAVGSLSISDTGRNNFYGQTANAWYLLQNEASSSDEDDADSPDLPVPNDLPWLSHAFPFTPNVSKTIQGVRGTLVSFLPDAAKAEHLADIYYRNAAWMYRPIHQSDFYETIFGRIYDLQSTSNPDPIKSHRIAVMYMILALGALLDPDRPPNSYDANLYYQLGRAALGVDSLFEEQSIPAIQALLLMSHYMFLSDIDGPRWALMGLVVKLAQGCGLHRDSGRWGLSADETHKRRSLMWEIYTYDSWQSLTYGRPPSFSLVHMDCRMAYEPFKNEQGEEEMGFELWKHRFASQCLSLVHDQAFGARTPSYKVIQELDKKVRDFYTPPSLQVPGFGGPMAEIEPSSLSLTMQRYIGLSIKEISLFYMHRGFFARAIADCPDDPLGSKYAPSVLAAYSSACSFVGLIKSLFSQQPRLTERMWFLFTHVFSCAIVLGSIPIKCPSMALSRSALSHLESASRLFDQVSENPRAVKVLPVLLKLKERAIASMSEMQTQNAVVPSSRFSSEDRDVKKEDDELATLGGKTRFVPKKTNSLPSSPAKLHALTGSSSPALAQASPPQSHVQPQSSASNVPAATPAAAPAPIPPAPINVLHPPTHLITDPQQWNGYTPLQHTPSHSHSHSHPHSHSHSHSYDYSTYSLSPDQWHTHHPAGFGYAGAQQEQTGMMIDDLSDQYSTNGFDFHTSLCQPGYLSQQTMMAVAGDGSGGSPSGDPTAAWHSLVAQVAQFNQP